MVEGIVCGSEKTSGKRTEIERTIVRLGLQSWQPIGPCFCLESDGFAFFASHLVRFAILTHAFEVDVAVMDARRGDRCSCQA